MKIYGEPLRYPSERYKNLFHTSYDELLKLLATESCGSFAIVATADDIKYILTSPGFRKGYIHKPTGQFSKKIGTLISILDDISIDAVGLASFLGYEGRLTYSHTIRTPFQNITQVKGGKEVVIYEGKVEQRSYLPLVYNQPTPDFESSLDDALSSLQDSTIALMFSGGKDSVALYAGLSDICGESSVYPVTVNMNPINTQGSEAIDISGVSSKVVEPTGGWPTTDPNICEHLTESMKHEFVDPLNPYHAISDCSYDYIISGHNVDAMLCADMSKPPQIPPLLATGNQIDYINYFVSNTLSNFPHWKVYTNNRSVRWIFLNILLPLLSKLSDKEVDRLGDPRVRTDEDDAIASMLTKTVPSKVNPSVGLNRTDIIRELNNARNWWKHSNSISPAKERCLLRYYSYAQNISSCGNIAGTSVSLPACWGPLIPVFLRPITHKDIRDPKFEIRDYIESKLGVSYSQIRKKSESQLRSYEQKQEYRLIERLKTEFDRGLSLEQYVDSDILTHEISDIKKKVLHSSLYSDPQYFLRNQSILRKSHRLLNVELMIKS